MISSILLIVFLLTLLSSCSTKEKEEKFFLSDAKQTLSFQLDRNTRNWTQAMFIYKDKDGQEYLTFQNEGQNEILFFSMKDQELKFKICPQIDGNNGVGMVLGYYIHNLDSIFLSISGLQEIAMIDKNANVVDKISYEFTKDSIPITQAYSTSAIYSPFVIIDNSLYIQSGCNRWNVRNPLCAHIDLWNKEVHSEPFDYPKFENADNKNKRAGIEEYVSRCYNGKEFVYSFYYKEDIYIASIDHQDVRQKKVKSKYVHKITPLNDYNQTEDAKSAFKQICENSNYGKLLYDKYRNVYYRIAYPETEIENDVNTMELMQYGRKVFSIIILDENYNTIGETLFPEYKYNADMIFIREDGLYISASHPMNPEFDDDVLCFHKFELKQND